MKLAQLQDKFARSLRGDRAFDVVAAGSLNAAQAISVYRRAHVARLTEALENTFAAVRRRLPEAKFSQLAQRYIRRFPSSFYNLSDYGEKFPTLLPTEFLRELGRFEWAFKNLFHEADVEKEFFVTEKVAPSQNPRFRFAQATRLLRHRFPTYAAWAQRGPSRIVRQAERLFLYKTAGEIRVIYLTPWAFKILLALRAGQNLQQAFKHCPPRNEGEVTELFQKLAASGAVASSRRKPG